jgi:hypothetical protein
MSTNRILGTKIPAQFDRDRAPGMRIDSGPHIAEVKDNSDQLFHGRLRVYIAAFGGDPEDAKSWFTVNYASPFFGEVNPNYKKPKPSTESAYGKTIQSYGMWFVPPDLGVTVLVTFAAGNPDLGYWFACIPTPRAHQMVPAIGSSAAYEEKDSATKADFPQVPVVEAVLDNRADFLSRERPVHTTQFNIVRDQGIAVDLDRSAITSSSHREAPSRVFGFSTPGRPDPDPAFQPDQIERTPNFEQKIMDAITGGDSKLAKELFQPTARKGGHSLVMDDGDILGNHQLVRLRTATGHQIMMNDTAGIIYVINAAGTAWVEMTPDGSINVYSGGDVSLRSKGSMNFHAEESIRFHAGKNITMKALENVLADGKNISLKAKEALIADGQTLLLVSDGDAILHGQTVSITSSGDLIISGSVDISSSGGSKPGSGIEIPTQDFPEPAKSGGVWRANTGNPTKSSVGVLPTHEPWTRPEKQVDKKSTQRTVTSPKDDNISPNTGTNSAAISAATSAGQSAAAAAAASPANTFKPDKNALQTVSKGLRVTEKQIEDQPDPPGTIGNLTLLQTKALYTQLALRESSLRYNVAGGRTESGTPTGNFLGKYQMGAEALADADYIDKKRLATDYKDRKTYAVRDDSVWTGKNGIKSKTDYLNNPAAQEDAMHKFTQKQYKTLTDNGVIRPSDSPEEVMGKLTTAHLLGTDGATNLFRNGVDGQDANKTWGKSYYELGRHAANVASNMEYTKTLAQNKANKPG